MSFKSMVIPDANESSEDESIPSEIIKKANEVINNLMPQKSRPKYEAAYEKFMQWRSEKKIKSFSESIFLSYFSELAENYKPSSLWATYSMLRSVIDIKHKVNIYNYSSLITFLKQKNKGYKSKKAQVLSAEQINQFLREAPDAKFLAMKVALIFGVQGVYRRHELCDLTIDDIEDKGDMLLVKIPKTKNDKPRSFIVTDDFYYLYKKYAISRPTNMTTTRFFINYRDGKCTRQVIGINTFGSIPKTVAAYLKLKDPESYIGHTSRRTSATLLADSGADLLTLKRHGGWKSNTVAEGYVEDSIGNKKRIGQQIASAISNRQSTSRENVQQINTNIKTTAEVPIEISVENKENEFDALSTNSKNISFNFTNCSNISIFINEKKE